jgi:hypothetical protein
MATDQEIYEILMRVEGEDKVAALTAEIRKQEDALAGLIRQQGAHSAAARAAASDVVNLRDQLASAEKAMGGLRGGGGNAALGIQQLANGFEDLQYSVGGAMNNMASAATMFGASAALSTGIIFVGIGINQLVKHWDDLAGAFGGTAARTASEEMEELGKKTKKTADEQARYNELKKQGQLLDAARGASEEVETGHRAVQKTIQELGDFGAEGMDKLREGLMATRGGAPGEGGLDRNAPGYEALQRQMKLRDQVAEMLKSGAYATSPEAEAMAGQQLAALDKAIKTGRDENRKMSADWAEQVIREAIGNQPKGLEKLRDIVASNQAHFPPETAIRLGEAWKEFEEANAAYSKRRKERERKARATESTETQYGDQEAAEQDRETAEYRRRKAANRKRAEDVAGQLFAGPLGREALAGTADTGDVRAAMEKLGFSGGTIDRRAGQVQEALRRRADDEARKRAAELGTDLGGGRASLAAEADRRASDERLKRAREAAPGIDELLKDAILGTAQAGGSGAAARDALARQLEGRFGAETARGLAGEAYDKAGAEYERGLVEGRKLRTSQLIDSAAVAGSIQQAVGGGQDIPKQQLDKLARIQQVLERMSQRPGQDNVARAG